MKLERNLTEEQVRDLMEDPILFIRDESERLIDYMIREGRIELSPENPAYAFVGNMAIDMMKNKVTITLNDMTKEEALLDVAYDERLKCYNVFALLPGTNEDDIGYSVDGNVLTITAGKYKGKAAITDNIVEISKTYKDGVFTLRLA